MTHAAISKPLCLPHTRKGGIFRRLLSLSKQRRDLARLDDRALEDIGVTRAEARAEAARPLWDAPNHWLK
ncbi:DUF1127 domain-containing protein [Ruegeria sp.]|uniref:DUF1127 domain-containing protein n=1 Tax=Ruegeria sp. TaxID=1879320 RepID=UPI003C7C8713